MMKLFDGAVFVLFMLSLSAMDSECMAVPAACCMMSLLYMLWRDVKLKKS